MNLDTIEKRMPEWYSSHEDIAYHKGGEYTICLTRSGTFRASYTPSRKTMTAVHKEMDGINYAYKGHGDATHFLNASGVFTDEELGRAYSGESSQDQRYNDWSIGMNPWFAVVIVSDDMPWPDDFEILHEIPTQEEWEDLVQRALEYAKEQDLLYKTDIRRKRNE